MVIRLSEAMGSAPKTWLGPQEAASQGSVALGDHSGMTATIRPLAGLQLGRQTLLLLALVGLARITRGCQVLK